MKCLVLTLLLAFAVGCAADRISETCSVRPGSEPEAWIECSESYMVAVLGSGSVNEVKSASVLVSSRGGAVVRFYEGVDGQEEQHHVLTVIIPCDALEVRALAGALDAIADNSAPVSGAARRAVRIRYSCGGAAREVFLHRNNALDDGACRELFAVANYHLAEAVLASHSAAAPFERRDEERAKQEYARAFQFFYEWRHQRERRIARGARPTEASAMNVGEAGLFVSRHEHNGQITAESYRQGWEDLCSHYLRVERRGPVFVVGFLPEEAKALVLPMRVDQATVEVFMQR